MTDKVRFGRKIRTLRKNAGWTQARLAEDLGISGSYLNLIEHEKRPLPAELLIRVAQLFELDLKDLGNTHEPGLIHDLLEAFGDPVFEDQTLTSRDVQDFANTSPEVARAVVELFQAYQAAHTSAETLAEKVADGQDFGGIDRSRLSSEQASDMIQKHQNHFPELEHAASRIWATAKLEGEDMFGGLARHLNREHGVEVHVLKVNDMRGSVRIYDPERKTLALSEVLRRGSRNFQLAHQLAFLECSRTFDSITDDPTLTSDESRSLARISLANYLAGAVLMPYQELLSAAELTRYDLDLLGHRFRVSFEQICHRLTALRGRGRHGVPFHFVRIDIAGNISKKFSGTGVRFPRFSGLCPLWNVHAAFLQPGRIRVQLSRLTDGTRFFSVARTVRKHRGGYLSPDVLHAIGLGCDIESARKLVYSDGIDLENLEAAVPLGTTCRLCERTHCQARSFPSLQRPMKIDENVRGVSFYTPIEEN